MKIAIFAWVGNGALADDIIGEVTKIELEKLGHICSFGPWNKDKNILVKQLKQFNAIIFGGGSLLCPTKIYPMNIFNYWYPKVKKPMHLFGTGFRKESNQLDKAQKILNKFLFSNLKTSWPRGKITDVELRKNGIVYNHTGFGDPGMLFEKTQKIDFVGPPPHLGIVVRNIPKKEVHYVQNNKVWAFYIDFIRAWIEKYSGSVHYVSFRHIKSGYDNDMEAMNSIRSKIHHKHQYCNAPKQAIYACDLIANMDHVVSQRLHPTIIGLSNGAKCVGLDYQFRKMEDFSSVIDFKYWMKTTKLNYNTALKWLEKGSYNVVYNNILKTKNEMRLYLEKTFGRTQ